MFYKEDIIRLGKEILELEFKMKKLERELAEKTTISTPLGGFVIWWEHPILVKDIVKSLVEELGYEIFQKTKPEVDTYIHKKKRKVKK